MTNKRMTPEPLLRTIAEAINEGVTRRDLATRFGKSQGWVDARRDEAVRAGLCVRKRETRTNSYSEERLARVADCLHRGLPYAAIAAEVGESASWVGHAAYVIRERDKRRAVVAARFGSPAAVLARHRHHRRHAVFHGHPRRCGFIAVVVIRIIVMVVIRTITHRTLDPVLAVLPGQHDVVSTAVGSRCTQACTVVRSAISRLL